MSLSKLTTLASVEILFQQGAIQVAWHTSIMEDGITISGPNVHRQAFSEVEDKTAILAEISAYVSADYVIAVERIAQLEQQLIQGESVCGALQHELEQMAVANAAHLARIAELENALAQQQTGAE